MGRLGLDVPPSSLSSSHAIAHADGPHGLQNRLAYRTSLSPPADYESKCSLPSISHLIRAADEHYLSMQRHRHVLEMGQSHHRPSHKMVAPSTQRGALPPTPPYRSRSLLSDRTSSSSSLLVASSQTQIESFATDSDMSQESLASTRHSSHSPNPELRRSSACSSPGTSSLRALPISGRPEHAFCCDRFSGITPPASEPSSYPQTPVCTSPRREPSAVPSQATSLPSHWQQQTQQQQQQPQQPQQPQPQQPQLQMSQPSQRPQLQPHPNPPHSYHAGSSTATTPTHYPQNHERYVCRTCNKAFSRPSSLRIHSHSHTGEKPYRCPHSGCGKAFSVRSNMKRHERGCHAASKMAVAASSALNAPVMV
ncbi:hypothetical protein KEM52_003628 [Ascosphaera acerosa]|nr:hypothetical protein KEM52_003628 [Ascosphaera acerosa]